MLGSAGAAFSQDPTDVCIFSWQKKSSPGVEAAETPAEGDRSGRPVYLHNHPSLFVSVIVIISISISLRFVFPHNNTFLGKHWILHTTHCILCSCMNAISINVVAIIGVAITVIAIAINVVPVLSGVEVGNLMRRLCLCVCCRMRPSLPLWPFYHVIFIFTLFVFVFLFVFTFVFFLYSLVFVCLFVVERGRQVCLFGRVTFSSWESATPPTPTILFLLKY